MKQAGGERLRSLAGWRDKKNLTLVFGGQNIAGVSAGNGLCTLFWVMGLSRSRTYSINLLRTEHGCN